MPVAIFSRTLVPSHFFGGKVLAWQCSVCRKLFCRTVVEVEHDGRNNPPIHIESEFHRHNCELVLVARQEQREAQRPARVSVEFGDTTRRGER